MLNNFFFSFSFICKSPITYHNSRDSSWGHSSSLKHLYSFLPSCFFLMSFILVCYLRKICLFLCSSLNMKQWERERKFKLPWEKSAGISHQSLQSENSHVYIRFSHLYHTLQTHLITFSSLQPQHWQQNLIPIQLDSAFYSTLLN